MKKRIIYKIFKCIRRDHFPFENNSLKGKYLSVERFCPNIYIEILRPVSVSLSPLPISNRRRLLMASMAWKTIRKWTFAVHRLRSSRPKSVQKWNEINETSTKTTMMVMADGNAAKEQRNQDGDAERREKKKLKLFMVNAHTFQSDILFSHARRALTNIFREAKRRSEMMCSFSIFTLT